MSSDFGDRKVLACVTGASGYIGAAVAVQFLQQGHSVRLPLRKQEQAKAWHAQYGKDYEGRLETLVLEKEMAEEGAFDKAVSGCDVVVHAASPATHIFQDAERDILKPAVQGTLSILKSAQKAPSVKSVVTTTSFSAYIAHKDAFVGCKDVHITEGTWNSVTYEDAAKMLPAQGSMVYAASKACSERAAWDFVTQNDVSFTLSTCAPSFTLGRDYVPGIKSLKDLHSTAAMALYAFWNKQDFPPVGAGKGFRVDAYVNVDDVARAHVAAALNPSRSNGHRYLLIGSRTCWEEIVRIMRDYKPELAAHLPPVPEQDPERTTRYTYDSEGIVRDLGVDYSPLEDLVKSYADQLHELAKADGTL
ncbi:hypothetical protein JCM10213_007026 [Rhodosporidiobolus nylandii]